MERWRLIEADAPGNAYMNLAIEEAIMVARGRGLVPNTIRLWRDAGSVLIGRFQSVEDEVNAQVSQDSGVALVRRPSGGGAVYQDLGNLNLSIAVDEANQLVPQDAGESFKTLSVGIFNSLRWLKLNPQFTYLDSILINGREVAEIFQTRREGAILQSATVFFGTDLDSVPMFLRKPKKMANLKSLFRQIEMDKLRELFKKMYERSYEIELVKGNLIREEKQMAKVLYDARYCRAEWNLMR